MDLKIELLNLINQSLLRESHHSKKKGWVVR
jgi:hypothetical protein